MSKTITVKGVGKVSVKPDLVVLSMVLESRNMNYEAALETAAESIGQLNSALAGAGFEKDSVKTTNFSVQTDYEDERRKDGSCSRVFHGYVVSHDLKAEFDFDSARLSRALSAVGSCPARPQMSIAFTVKDAAAVSEEMLRSAAVNARRRAEVLCGASGVKLGDLLTIDYSWGERNFRSDTNFAVAGDCLAAPMMSRAVEIEPDEIRVSDSATFVWELR